MSQETQQPTKEVEQQLNVLKKAPLSSRKDQILSEIHSIITGPYEDSNVTKDLQRLCQNTIFQVEKKENEFENVPFTKLDLSEAPTVLILQDLFNFLVSFLCQNTDNEVNRWLKVIGFENYIENFQKNGFHDLITLIYEGLNEEDFKILEITNRGDIKKLKFCLDQLPKIESPFKFKYLPITNKEITREIQLHDPNTLTQFITKRFKDFPAILNTLKCFHQAIVVSFLGHLGESVFYTSGLRFKDVKGSWKVIIKYNNGYDRNNHIPFISIVHKRSEMVLNISENKRLQDLFSFEWEIEIQFNNVDLDDIHQIKAKLNGFDWSSSPKKDSSKEEKEVLEKNITSVFENLNILNNISKKKQDEPKKKKTQSTFGFWSSYQEEAPQK